eukprot:6181623-Pleurochrysis_carterae.AAC.3
MYAGLPVLTFARRRNVRGSEQQASQALVLAGIYLASTYLARDYSGEAPVQPPTQRRFSQYSGRSGSRDDKIYFSNCKC